MLLLSGFNVGNSNFNREIKIYSRLVIQGYDDITFELFFGLIVCNTFTGEIEGRVGFKGAALGKYRFCNYICNTWPWNP